MQLDHDVLDGAEPRLLGRIEDDPGGVRPDSRVEASDAIAKRSHVAPQRLEVGALRLDWNETGLREAAEEVHRGVADVRAAIDDEVRFGHVVETAVLPLHEDLVEDHQVAGGRAHPDRCFGPARAERVGRATRKDASPEPRELIVDRPSRSQLTKLGSGVAELLTQRHATSRTHTNFSVASEYLRPLIHSQSEDLAQCGASVV